MISYGELKEENEILRAENERLSNQLIQQSIDLHRALKKMGNTEKRYEDQFEMIKEQYEKIMSIKEQFANIDTPPPPHIVGITINTAVCEVDELGPG